MTETSLIMLSRRLESAGPADARAVLTFDQRRRSRQRVRLEDGREAGILLPRGERLRNGDLLSGDGGLVVQVVAAPESLSTAVSDDRLLLARACYHLGNRHVAVQIEPGRLRWLHDHVVDDMVRGLGLTVILEQGPFEPEPGAYGGDGHRHGHDG